MATKKKSIPLIPLRGLIVFPGMILHFDVGRRASKNAIEEAMSGDRLIMLSYQPDMFLESPKKEDVSGIGTLAEIKQILKLPDGNIRVLVDGIKRKKITRFYEGGDALHVLVDDVSETPFEDALYEKVLMHRIQHLLEDYLDLYERITPETINAILAVEDPGELADITAANFPLKTEQKQEILEESDVRTRLEKLIMILEEEIQVLEVERQIAKKTQDAIDKNQREYMLREQMKVLQGELEEYGDKTDVKKFRDILDKHELPEEVEKKLREETDKMAKQPAHSQEYGVIQSYIEAVLALEWTKKSPEITDIKKAEKILERDHYGLEKVKERILEYIAVKQLKEDEKGTILCLVGPPGTGKTSIAKSLAEALGRKYVRISLGGVNNEAEIRGHRKTYVGAMPGRIMDAMKKAGTKNPLILLDEIDKMSSDYKGDPQSAMLEVLDPEQNKNFRDHYIELEYDLSDVMFITTANTLENIQRPLLDRMDVIEISGYTNDEKLNIAKKYLVPKQREKHGITGRQLKISDKMLMEIIDGYTRESGVRNLERKIGTVCRKTARDIIEGKAETVSLNEKTLIKYLGKRIYTYDKVADKEIVGVANGLAWTESGGDTLSIEVNTMKGSGKLELTGNLGDVMKESAKTALSFIRANSDDFEIEDTFYKEKDIHIHVPEGAIPKDGPSAGITMATALVSALSDVPVKADVAMTGEITLRGRVLPIGGLKEKTLAAYRMGISKVIIPYENKKDYEELPEKIKSGMDFVFAKDMDTVLKNALKK